MWHDRSDRRLFESNQIRIRFSATYEIDWIFWGDEIIKIGLFRLQWKSQIWVAFALEEELNYFGVKLLLLCIKMSQVRWFSWNDAFWIISFWGFSSHVPLGIDRVNQDNSKEIINLCWTGSNEELIPAPQNEQERDVWVSALIPVQENLENGWMVWALILKLDIKWSFSCFFSTFTFTSFLFQKCPIESLSIPAVKTTAAHSVV